MKCSHCNNGISYTDSKGDVDHMNAHSCEHCHGTGQRPTCKSLTTKSARCKRAAVHDGYCTTHARYHGII